jgi:Domain of unknown function (DUF4189)
MKKLLTFMLGLFIYQNIFAASAIYMSYVNGKHFIKINRATGDEAEPFAKRNCEKWILQNGEPDDKCLLVYKTNYGGYGSIAIGKKGQGYSLSNPTQERADRIAMEECLKSSPTCEVVSRWKDEGMKKVVTVFKTYSYSHWDGYRETTSPGWTD